MPPAGGDHYAVWLVTVLERAWWWNPLTWLLGAIARRHLEYDCDQRCRDSLGLATYQTTLAEIALEQRARARPSSRNPNRSR